MSLKGVKVGFCMTGSFCTFEKAFAAAQALKAQGAELVPIMSFNAAALSTRFGRAEDNISRLELIAGKPVIRTIVDAEPIGPKKLCDVMAVVPCTSNTAAKLANGIVDTPAAMAVKSHVRNERPVVIAISTNDALGACARSIGTLQSMRNYYFVPYGQDAPDAKPRSAIADMTKLTDTIEAALRGEQLRPILL